MKHTDDFLYNVSKIFCQTKCFAIFQMKNSYIIELTTHALSFKHIDVELYHTHSPLP